MQSSIFFLIFLVIQLLSLFSKELQKNSVVFVYKNDTHCLPLKDTLAKRSEQLDLTFLNKTESENYGSLAYFDFFFSCSHPNYDKLSSKLQTINNINGSKYILLKHSLVKTLKEFDKKHLYSFNSDHIIPLSFYFNLNQKGYSKQEKNFMEKQKQLYWITKNPNKSQGSGIQIFKNPREVKKIVDDLKKKHNIKENDDYKKVIDIENSRSKFLVVQKYITNPLLWDGFKFDMRSYVFIASTNPFVVLFQHGYIRRSPQKFDISTTDFSTEDISKHIVNNYSNEGGYLSQNRKKNVNEFLQKVLVEEHNFSQQDLDVFNQNTRAIVLYCALAAKDLFSFKNGQHLILGFDMNVDNNFKQYLLEFNKYPIFDQTEEQDQILPHYQKLIEDYFDIIFDSHQDFSKKDEFWANITEEQLGGWEVLYNGAKNYNYLDEITQKKADMKEQHIHDPKKIQDLLDFDI